MQSESNVVIGADGYLKGQIKAATVVVSGRVDGSIAADRLEIIADGAVEGDVHTVNLVIEPGGRFNGSSEIVALETTGKSPDTEKKQPDPEPAKTRKSAQSRADEVQSAPTA